MALPIVDAHCHIYPPKIAARAVDSVGEFYHLAMLGVPAEAGITPGTPEHLLAVSAGSGITHHLVHSVAVKAATVESINTFIAQQCAVHPNFIGFAAMHQDYEDPRGELERAKAAGLKGIKIHPDTQCVNLDDDRLMEVYAIAEELGLPVLIHMGDYRYDYSHPRRLKRVLQEFPGLVVCGAHFGGWSVFDLAVEYLQDERCFLDCSSSMAFIGLRRTRELIELYGADRILFGSDFPMWDPGRELERLRSLGLPAADWEKITLRNVERFTGVDLT